jgi:hypothetical protein
MNTSPIKLCVDARGMRISFGDVVLTHGARFDLAGELYSIAAERRIAGRDLAALCRVGVVAHRFRRSKNHGASTPTLQDSLE